MFNLGKCFRANIQFSSEVSFSWMIAQTINQMSRTLLVEVKTIYVGYTESLSDKLHID